MPATRDAAASWGAILKLPWLLLTACTSPWVLLIAPCPATAAQPAKMASHKDIPGLTVQRYQEIIDSVVGKVRSDFNQEGIDE